MEYVDKGASAGIFMSETNPVRWSQIINDVVCRVDIVAGRASHFLGAMHARELGQLKLMTIDAERELAHRERRHIASDADEAALLMVVESGELRISQLGRELIVRPDMAVFYDLTVPYTFYHSDRSRFLAVKVPIHALSARLGRPSNYLGRTYGDRSGPVAVTTGYLGSLMHMSGELSQSFAAEYGAKSFDLIALMLESSESGTSVSRSRAMSALFRRAVAVIDSELSNVNLEPAMLARRIGISTRYLHRVFQDAGTTVNEQLRERRLEHARRDLTSAARRNLSVGEIASRAGFASLPHFSRSFRKRFGVSASSLRRGRAVAVG